MRRRDMFLVLASLFCGGCADDEADKFVDPNQLQLRCDGSANAACDEVEPAPIESEIADQYVFGVGCTVEFNEIAVLSRNVFSGNTAVRPGIGAALTRGGQYVHLEVRAVATLLITHENAEGRFDEILGVDPIALRVPTDRLRAVLVDDAQNVLGGGLDIRWTSDNPAVISVVGGTTSTVAEIAVGEEGTAKIIVEANEWRQEVDVDVVFN